MVRDTVRAQNYVLSWREDIKEYAGSARRIRTVGIPDGPCTRKTARVEARRASLFWCAHVRHQAGAFVRVVLKSVCLRKDAKGRAREAERAGITHVGARDPSVL